MIAKMNKVEIVCLREIMQDVTLLLQDKGLIHVEEVPLACAEVPDFLNRACLAPEQTAESEALESMYRNISEVTQLLSVKPNPHDIISASTTLRALKNEDRWASAKQWIRELRSYSRRKINAKDNLEVLSQFLKVLTQLEPIVGDKRDIVLGKNARAFVLKGDIAGISETIDNRLKELIGLKAIFVHKQLARDTMAAIVMYPEELDSVVSKIFREEGITPFDAPDKNLRGLSFEQVVRRLHESIDKQKHSLQQIQSELDTFSKDIGAKVAALELMIRDECARFNVVNQFAQSQMVGVIHGWVPADDQSALEKALDDKYPGQVLVSIQSVTEVPAHTIPTLLKNHPILKPFEVLLSILRPPTYGTYDPTGLVAVSFILFYGFILGDVVYGLAVLAFAFWLNSKWGYNPIVRSASVVGKYMAASSVLFGVLFGEYCGDLGMRLFGVENVPHILHRSHDHIPLLMLAIAIGAIHIPLALIIGIRESLHHGHKEHAMEKLGMLMGLTGIAVGAAHLAGVSVFAASAVGILALMLYGIGAVLILRAMGAMGIVNILEIFSLVGNVLSYARLMALGIASVIIADLANQLPEAIGYIIGVPLAAAIHVFNIGIGMFSPTLHSLRLNYVEFLPKFYSPEGKSYKPFKKEALW
ncbi:MAG: hypothetical protein AMXMBFR84_28850 [Candidatus Hydrogenedentota bacterium]